MSDPRKQDPIDTHVGGRIRLRRIAMGISQSALADRLGITFQQVQKYEKGGNRVSASKLYRIAEILAVPVTFFFEGLRVETEADAQAIAIDRILRKPQAVKILQLAAIMNDGKLAALARCAEALAEHFSEPAEDHPTEQEAA